MKNQTKNKFIHIRKMLKSIDPEYTIYVGNRQKRKVKNLIISANFWIYGNHIFNKKQAEYWNKIYRFVKSYKEKCNV